tara:strand:- start:3902 stop:4096 length:195 start_codon:yes stop_codon:yes gene_type:complete
MLDYKMRKVGQTLEIEHLVFGWVSLIAANPERVLMERRDPVSGQRSKYWENKSCFKLVNNKRTK